LELANRLPMILLMVFAALICIVAAVGAYRSRSKVSRSGSFAVMAISGAAWMMGTVFDDLATSLFWKEIWWVLTTFAILNTLMGLFFFSLEFSLRLQRVPRGILFAAVSITLIIVGIAITNPIHHLMWMVVVTLQGIVRGNGHLYSVFLVYMYFLGFASLGLLIRAFINSRGILRVQTVLLILGLLNLLAVSIAVDVFHWDPLPYADETPLSFVATVILFGLATLRFNQFYLLPIATDMIIKTMSDGILVTDLENRVIFSNPGALKVLGKTSVQIRGEQISKVLKEWRPEAGKAWVGDQQDIELEIGSPEPQFYHLTISNLSRNSRSSTGQLLIMNNITDHKKIEIYLKELAMTDPLTGMFNRRHFFSVAGLLLSQARRYKHPLSILIFDVDEFKHVNDTYGHAIGDQALKLLAECIKKTIRSSDVAARFGGDEFVILAPETDAFHAAKLGERLRLLVASQVISAQSSDIQFKISLGVAAFDLKIEISTIDTVLEQADRALYIAKQGGGNQVQVFKLS
jgi:diguanylate cyclase (GGDEF)-like protein